MTADHTHLNGVSGPLTSQAPSESSTALLMGIINASQSYIAYFDVVRDTAEPHAIIDFTFRLVNDRFASMVQSRLDQGKYEQLLGLKLTTLFPGVHAAGILSRYIAVVESGQAATIEEHYQTDGLNGWYMITAQPLGEGLVVSFLDVTVRKQAELQARQQADQLEATFNASTNSILLMRAIRDEAENIVDFLMLTANKAVRKSLFREPEALVGKTLLSVFPGNVEGGFFALYARVANTGVAESAEYFYQDDNGFTGWFDVSVARSSPDHVMLTFNNVTTSKEASLAQQRQAQLLQVILDHSQTAISLHTAIRNKQGEIIDFQVVTANQQAIQNWGEQAQDFLTKSYLTIFPGEKDSENFNRYVRVVESGQPESFDMGFQDHHYNLTIAKADTGIVLTSVDVTADRRYRQSLEAINKNLQQSNENLQSFAYVASHDLQEPLRKIQQFGDIVQDRYGQQIGETGADLVMRMQKAADRMSTLIRDLLAFSRLSTQQQPLKPVDLTQLVSDVLNDLYVVIQERKAVVAVDQLGTVQGDASQLRQLIQNLLTNALKFAKPGQAPLVTITFRLASVAELPPSLTENDAFYCLSVTDEGIGFDASQYGERIFGTFQRLHGKDQFAGTGIGLAVVKKVAERHGGTVSVRSTPGNGATFNVFLAVNPG
ncbi:PAS domain-containing protein [Fibrella sp. HMF5335]|uniref:histidine kinase n=1 Tax=Fibrella rubiginis TaxID=2817060 RepID=A0A939K3U9_9BACT|nr:ATP-binding protein [Fibrella rubiginis]MBO0939637.1 PAS domain-containing protein [Fibrella rubiginis]